MLFEIKTMLLLFWVFSLLYVYFHLFVYTIIYSLLKLITTTDNQTSWLYEDYFLKKEFSHCFSPVEKITFFKQKEKVETPAFIFSKNRVKYKIIILVNLVLDYIITNVKNQKTTCLVFNKFKTIFTNLFTIKKVNKCFYDFFFYKDITPSFIVFTELYKNQVALIKFFIIKKFKLYLISFKNSYIYLRLQLFFSFIILNFKKVLIIWKPISARLPYFKKINKK